MDELSKEELEQLLDVFREQSVRILDEMGNDLLALEAGAIDAEITAGPPAGAAVDDAAILVSPDWLAQAVLLDVLDQCIERRTG